MPDTKLFSKKGQVYVGIFIWLMFYVQEQEYLQGNTEPGWWQYPSAYLGLFIGTVIVTISILPGGFEKEQWLARQEALGKL